MINMQTERVLEHPDNFRLDSNASTTLATTIEEIVTVWRGCGKVHDDQLYYVFQGAVFKSISMDERAMAAVKDSVAD